MEILAQKKKELEALLKELESSDNVVLQNKAKAYREKFSAESNDEMPKKDYASLIKDLKDAIFDISVLKGDQLISSTLLNLKSTIGRLENAVNLALKDAAIENVDRDEIKLEWANVGVAISALADLLMSKEAKEIKALLETESDENRKKAEERFNELKEIYGLIKELYQLVEKNKTLNEKAFSELEKLIEPENNREDLGESESVNLDFKIIHHKKNINFKKKEELIKKIVDETVVFDELVDETTDIERFKTKLTDDLKLKIEGELDKLETILEKEVEKGQNYPITLPVAFKKVKEDGQTGWIIDIEKTKAPEKKPKEKEEGTLSYEPKVVFSPKPKLNKNVFISKLEYTIPVTRAAFKHKKFNLLKFLPGATAAIAAAILALGKTKKDEAAPLLIAGGGVVAAITAAREEKTTEEKTKTVKCSVTLKHDTQTDNVTIDVEYSEDIEDLGFKRGHQYHSNMNEAVEMFKANVDKKL